jgi:hypothetical protein
MTAEDKQKIAPLKGSENYEVWHQEVMLLLLRKNAWKCIKTNFELSKKTTETVTEYSGRLTGIYKIDTKIEEIKTL